VHFVTAVAVAVAAVAAVAAVVSREVVSISQQVKTTTARPSR